MQILKECVFASALLACSTAWAITIDPSVYFAYSEQPFQGGQRVFLSKLSCPLKDFPSDASMRDRFDVLTSGRLKWKRGLYNTEYGPYAGCWAAVKSQGQDGLISCVVANGAITQDCVLMANRVFRNTADLPVRPGPAKF